MNIQGTKVQHTNSTDRSLMLAAIQRAENESGSVGSFSEDRFTLLSAEGDTVYDMAQIAKKAKAKAERHEDLREKDTYKFLTGTDNFQGGTIALLGIVGAAGGWIAAGNGLLGSLGTSFGPGFLMGAGLGLAGIGIALGANVVAEHKGKKSAQELQDSNKVISTLGRWGGHTDSLAQATHVSTAMAELGGRS